MLSQPWIDCGRANKQAGLVEGKQAGWMGRILVVVEAQGCWSCAREPVGWVWRQDWMPKDPWWVVWKRRQYLPQLFDVTVPVDS